MDENIRKLKELVDGSDNIVFFGGAGVSTRFIPYEALLVRFGQPDRKHYETVYDGLVGTNDPEEIYTLFRDPVPGYDGRPIGISDVLELYDEGGSEFYYCDRVGFRQIEFAPQQEMDMSL